MINCYCYRSMLEQTGDISIWNTSDNGSDENFQNHMNPDEEFVFVMRSGEHGRGNNVSGLSLRIYKKSDFIYELQNPGYNTIQSKLEDETTMIIDDSEGHYLWLNGRPRNFNASNPQGVADHGFEYKHVIWDYRCITDEEVEDYLVFSFGEALGPEPEPEPEVPYFNDITVKEESVNYTSRTYYNLTRPVWNGEYIPDGITIIIQAQAETQSDANYLFSLYGNHGNSLVIMKFMVCRAVNSVPLSPQLIMNTGLEHGEKDHFDLDVWGTWSDTYADAGDLWQIDQVGVKYQWVYKASGDTQSFTRYSINENGGLKIESVSYPLEPIENSLGYGPGQNAAQMEKYRIWINGPTTSSSSYQADYTYHLLKINMAGTSDSELRAMAVEYLELEPEPEPVSYTHLTLPTKA